MPSYNPVALSRTASDADASTFFAACVTAGTTLSAGQQAAIQLLVQGFKQTGLWTKMTAVYPFIGGTAGCHAINLKSPGTYNITWTSVTHNSNGITGNGTSAYGDTGLNTSSVLSLNSTHLSFYSRTGGSFAYEEMASASSGTSFQLAAQWSNGATYYAQSSVQINTPAPGALGLIATSRTSSTSTVNYNRSRKVVSSNQVSVSLPNRNVFILAGNNSGTAINFSARNLAFSSIGSGLSDQDAINLSTLVQAYQSSLGRAV